MHPEIVRSEPGACPICGMALEPREVTGEEVNPELVDMTRRFWTSVALTVPILMFMISVLIPGDPLLHAIGMRASQWVQFALATPVVLWGGWPFFQRAAASIRNRSLNMFTLIGLGTGSAYFYSVFALLFPDAIPSSFRDMGGRIGEAGAALVPHDEPCDLRQLFDDGGDRTCGFVHKLDVAEPTGIPHQRRVTLAKLAVREPDRAVTCVANPPVGHIDILASPRSEGQLGKYFLRSNK